MVYLYTSITKYILTCFHVGCSTCSRCSTTSSTFWIWTSWCRSITISVRTVWRSSTSCCATCAIIMKVGRRKFGVSVRLRAWSCASVRCRFALGIRSSSCVCTTLVYTGVASMRSTIALFGQLHVLGALVSVTCRCRCRWHRSCSRDKQEEEA